MVEAAVYPYLNRYTSNAVVDIPTIELGQIERGDRVMLLLFNPVSFNCFIRVVQLRYEAIAKESVFEK